MKSVMSCLMVSTWLLAFALHAGSAPYQIVCSGQDAGGYAAFPDVCRLKNGDLYCVFYSGYGHVSKPNAAWPKGGRIMAVRSKNQGQTWSKPEVAIDTPRDDRDPSVTCLRDGALLLVWFCPCPDQKGKNEIIVMLARSTDGGKTWSEPARLELDSPYWFACSTPVRELADGSLILGLYHHVAGRQAAFGATVKSYDGGKTWKDLALIGQDAGKPLDAETDVIPLADGKLLAALRAAKIDMHYALSDDLGKTWGPVQPLGFVGHCPYFLRHKSGVILLGHRLPATSLHWSADEGRTWHGPVQIDSVIGAYPSMIELPDGLVYCVYYEEGKGSSIRAVRLQVSKDGVKVAGDDKAIVPAEAKLEKLWGDGEFTEGPAQGADGRIYFSDIGNRIMVFDPATSQTTVFRDPSGRANGLDIDPEGRLVAAEGANAGGNRRITRTEKDGTIRVLAERWQGKRFNSPNDLTIDKRGRIYFTDPRYAGDEPREIATESVYRIDPDGTVSQIITDVEKPNGIALSPDMKTLYLAESNPRGNQHLLSYPLRDDGTVGPKKMLHDFGKGRGIDGMSMDVDGNIYGAAGSGASGGVYVFNPQGKQLAFVPTPEPPTNCVFGGKDRKTLYVTAGKSLYRIRLGIPGFGVFWPKDAR